MGKEIILLGIAAAALGIGIYWRFGVLVPSIALAILGLILIIFNGEEGKIEKRRDKK